METSYIVTFIGDDRPGLVEELARAISDNGGNWLESRSSQLAGKFAGLVLVRLPADRGEKLERDLKALSDAGLSVRVTRTSGGTVASAADRAVRLTVIGPDRNGIVREISGELSARQVNVVEMETHVISAPMSAEPLFEAHIEATIAPDQDLDELQDRLDEIANRMTLDINLDAIDSIG